MLLFLALLQHSRNSTLVTLSFRRVALRYCLPYPPRTSFLELIRSPIFLSSAYCREHQSPWTFGQHRPDTVVHSSLYLCFITQKLYALPWTADSLVAHACNAFSVGQSIIILTVSSCSFSVYALLLFAQAG